MPSAYNNNIQLFQTEDHVAILVEMVHDFRIIPLDGRPHLSGDIRQWFGDARAHWDGDTLVVETTNFTDKTGSFDPLYSITIGEGTWLTLTERYRRLDADTLLYEYTVNDPTTFTRPLQRSFRCGGPRSRSTSTRVTRGTTPCRTCWAVRVPTSGQRVPPIQQLAEKNGAPCPDAAPRPRSDGCLQPLAPVVLI